MLGLGQRGDPAVDSAMSFLYWVGLLAKALRCAGGCGMYIIRAIDTWHASREDMYDTPELS